MGSISEFFHMITSPGGFEQLIAWGGYVILFIIIFSETGLLVGFFLPGDSLLVTAGVLAAAGKFNLDILWLNLLLIPAAIIGDAVGYTIGLRGGSRLLNRPDSRFFKKRHIDETRAFYAKHGGKTIVLARFIPVIRTFAPVVAGLARMPYREFAVFNIAGGVLWIGATTIVGYVLGSSIKNIDQYLHYVIFVVILVSLIPVALELIKARRRKRAALEKERA
ncbi:MAG: associated Golgi protein [Chlorobi bacterium]|nr:associated Golgi protein [Chlorobiota bacterium]